MEQTAPSLTERNDTALYFSSAPSPRQPTPPLYTHSIKNASEVLFPNLPKS